MRNMPRFTEDQVHAATSSRQQNYLTDDDLDAYIDQCRRDPEAWHAITEHASTSAAAKRIHQLRTRPRTKGMPIVWRVYPTPVEEVQAGRARAYVVGKWDSEVERPSPLKNPWMIVDEEPWFVYENGGEMYAKTLELPDSRDTPRVTITTLAELIARMEKP